MFLKETNCVMVVLGFVTSTIFIAFVCVRLITGRIQRRASRMSPRSDPSSLECGSRGLEPYVLSNFPTKKYIDKSFSSSDDSQCIICLAEYCKNDTIRTLPSCDHFFHKLCIDEWLNQHSTCPVCRISLREFPSETKTTPTVSSSRSHYQVESLEFDSYFCLPPIEDRPVIGNQRTGPIANEGVRESFSIMIDGSRNKHGEHPSGT